MQIILALAALLGVAAAAPGHDKSHGGSAWIASSTTSNVNDLEMTLLYQNELDERFPNMRLSTNGLTLRSLHSSRAQIRPPPHSSDGFRRCSSLLPTQRGPTPGEHDFLQYRPSAPSRVPGLPRQLSQEPAILDRVRWIYMSGCRRNGQGLHSKLQPETSSPMFTECTIRLPTRPLQLLQMGDRGSI
ncbi:hypothetical protein SAICODRAFT_29235 [Saitoella complicata NRRL Y-17804]|uniref:uncharacterized protein n=1 Tax=Saitoella complicata (strain BCRC 22490 / CBS 7301 / JCM 7358 / NBRC 10748 / NRRL Y-17804) TaxID=698492 RepID=UPI000866CDE2|nr:uncharacterized protein SAICODRAFT_29235 [Saitoella complicata NRRL Y-17804]ODQ55051.1 hypothetical protein SAICODRAFT_29235 [Saitoella complicata NRRL Y-17804]